MRMQSGGQHQHARNPLNNVHPVTTGRHLYTPAPMYHPVFVPRTVQTPAMGRFIQYGSMFSSTDDMYRAPSTAGLYYERLADNANNVRHCCYSDSTEMHTATKNHQATGKNNNTRYRLGP